MPCDACIGDVPWILRRYIVSGRHLYSRVRDSRFHVVQQLLSPRTRSKLQTGSIENDLARSEESPVHYGSLDYLDGIQEVTGSIPVSSRGLLALATSDWFQLLSERTVESVLIRDQSDTRSGCIHLIGAVPVNCQRDVTRAAAFPSCPADEH